MEKQYFIISSGASYLCMNERFVNMNSPEERKNYSWISCIDFNYPMILKFGSLKKANNFVPVIIVKEGVKGAKSLFKGNKTK
jgi:hypothetical protein